MSRPECHWMQQCSPGCQERAAHANAMWPLIHDAVDKNEELRRAAQVDQFDLFAPSASGDLVSLWESIHRALGEEYRRRAGVFHRGCPTWGQVAAMNGAGE